MRSLIEEKVRRLLADKKFSDILHGSVLALGARICSTALAMVINVVVARYYGAETMGILAMVNSFFLFPGGHLHQL
jgi:O-antigen/teichoic acid export membrane protein